jgi:hypothetical protein
MMAGVLAAAVRDRQAAGPAEFEFAGETLQLDAEVVREATRRARAARPRWPRSPPGRPGARGSSQSSCRTPGLPN